MSVVHSVIYLLVAEQNAICFVH